MTYHPLEEQGIAAQCRAERDSLQGDVDRLVAQNGELRAELYATRAESVMLEKALDKILAIAKAGGPDALTKIVALVEVF